MMNIPFHVSNFNVGAVSVRAAMANSRWCTRRRRAYLPVERLRRYQFLPMVRWRFDDSEPRTSARRTELDAHRQRRGPTSARGMWTQRKLAQLGAGKQQELVFALKKQIGFGIGPDRPPWVDLFAANSAEAWWLVGEGGEQRKGDWRARGRTQV